MPSATARTHCITLLLLVAVSVAAGCFAAVVPKHVCHYDQIHPDTHEPDLPRVEPPASDKPLTAEPADAGTDAKPKQNMRIVFSSLDLKKSSKHCDKAGAQRTDVFGENVACSDDDVLTEKKRSELHKIVRSAINMHTARLNVTPLQDAVVVPELTGPLCKLLTVPKPHNTKGVADADMVLYVASFPSSKAEMFAAGAPCALLDGDKRPVVGALTYTTKHITPTVYSVRVAMHEMAHALGFTYTMMEEVFAMPMKENKDVRKKTVKEVQTKTVVAMAKKYYECDSLTGMELEDEAGILSTPSHSHWERRNALEELMAGIVTAGLYTKLTLAAFHDMKVYEADFDKAETMQWGSDGCAFLTQRCVFAGDGKALYSTFCVQEDNIEGVFCAPGRRAMGRCSPVIQQDNIPETYQSTNATHAGEARLLTDRCPIFEEHDDLSCTDENSKAPGLKGADSWCFRKMSKRRGGTLFPNGGCGRVALATDGNVTVDMGPNNSKYTCQGPSNGYSFGLTDSGKYTSFQCPSIAEVGDTDEFYSAYDNESESGNAEATPTATHVHSQMGDTAQNTKSDKQKPADQNSKDDATAINKNVVSLLMAAVLLLMCL